MQCGAHQRAEGALGLRDKPRGNIVAEKREDIGGFARHGQGVTGITVFRKGECRRRTGSDLPQIQTGRCYVRRRGGLNSTPAEQRRVGSRAASRGHCIQRV